MAEAKSRRELTPRPRTRSRTDLPADGGERPPEERAALLTESASADAQTLEPREERETPAAEQPQAAAPARAPVRTTIPASMKRSTIATRRSSAAARTSANCSR